MKLLITGGLGFIFSHVTQYFVKKGYEVIVIDNCSVGSHPEIVDGSFKFYKEDLAEEKTKNIILQEKPDYIIHAAGITDVDFSIREPEIVLKNNILCNIHAFEAARKLPIKKFLYVSTDEIYGECEYRKKENEIIFPRNPYSASRADGSLLRTAYDITYKELSDKTAEIRMCNIFGPRQDPRKIMPLIMKSVKEGVAIPLHAEGKMKREWLYVKNIPPAVELVLQKGNRVYNITNNDEYSVREIIEKIESLTGKKVKTYPAERPGADFSYKMDNSRIKELGWKPLYSFEKGLKEYVETF